jgi:hypothetical protein
MPFRMIHQCTDCDALVEDHFNHDCPNDPAKDPVKRAEAEAWQTEFDRNTKVWNDYQTEHGQTKVAYPAVDGDPTDIAFEGRCVILDEGDEFWGGEGCENYVSDVLENPTWGDLLYLFDAAIEKTKDNHHSFLEGHYLVENVPEFVGDTPEDVTVLRFAGGS